jgi:hypothetical protein
MTNNSNSTNNDDHRPTNRVQFEMMEVKHRYGLDKYPDTSTEDLLVSLRDLVNSMDPPSYSRQTDLEYLSLKCRALNIVELLGIRIMALYNRIDK